MRAELDEGDPLPDLLDADLVIAMGGPMSVNDEADHPWLAEEKQQIARAVGAGVPFFGVCLGAQLLAASFGAPVRAGEVPEVGVLPVELTEAGRADPVLSGLADELPDTAVARRHASTCPPGPCTSDGRPPTPIRRFVSARVPTAFSSTSRSPTRCSRTGARCPRMSPRWQATFGHGGFAALSRAFELAREEMAGSARRLFEAWLSRSAAREAFQASWLTCPVR